MAAVPERGAFTAGTEDSSSGVEGVRVGMWVGLGMGMGGGVEPEGCMLPRTRGTSTAEVERAKAEPTTREVKRGMMYEEQKVGGRELCGTRSHVRGQNPSPRPNLVYWG